MRQLHKNPLRCLFLILQQGLINLLRSVLQRSAHPTQLRIGSLRQLIQIHRSPLPKLQERVLQQGQTSQQVFHIRNHPLYQFRLDFQAYLFRRFLDRFP